MKEMMHATPGKSGGSLMLVDEVGERRLTSPLTLGSTTPTLPPGRSKLQEELLAPMKAA